MNKKELEISLKSERQINADLLKRLTDLENEKDILQKKLENSILVIDMLTKTLDKTALNLKGFLGFKQSPSRGDH